MDTRKKDRAIYWATTGMVLYDSGYVPAPAHLRFEALLRRAIVTSVDLIIANRLQNFTL